ncbi:hypothetical protein HPB50_019530 [Hyalomma asiaticum]|uniref:Uncharacterized protein n=1 Tax=Hyalomma asiaticum TaxID=266040 RepID=A0ACB7S1N2_HYAAI|nr:hypothetical protein HPB50_019530 [Hyalomma asiaticum]
MNSPPQLLHSGAPYRRLGRLVPVIELFHTHEKLGVPPLLLSAGTTGVSDTELRSAHLLDRDRETPAGITDGGV